MSFGIFGTRRTIRNQWKVVCIMEVSVIKRATMLYASFTGFCLGYFDLVWTILCHKGNEDCSKPVVMVLGISFHRK